MSYHTMPLTDLTIKRAKPRDKPYKLTDEKGLYVIVRPDGAKWWRLDFTIKGQPRRTMSLGVYPDVELADARTERERIRKLVKAGVDPVHERRSGLTEAESTFEAIARQWLAANRNEWEERTYNIRCNRLERHVFPVIGKRDIRSLEPTDMLSLIKKIEAEGAAELPWRMNADCGRIFRFAIASGWNVRDATADIKDAITKQPAVRHRAFIKPKDMGAFLLKFHENGPESNDTKEAMLLTILSACRTVELRFAARHEFEDLDTERPLWRIPAERMKMKREHLVPLPRQAAAIVRSRLERLPAGQKLLFGRLTVSGTMSENTLIYVLYRLGYHSRATVHGFRSTFSTLANEATKLVDGEEVRMWEPDWIERQLAHVPEDKVRAAYNAAEYLPQRRRLLQWWADWLDEQLEMKRLIG